MDLSAIQPPHFDSPGETLLQDLKAEFERLTKAASEHGKAVKLEAATDFGEMTVWQIHARGNFLFLHGFDTKGEEMLSVEPASRASFRFSFFVPTKDEVKHEIGFGAKKSA